MYSPSQRQQPESFSRRQFFKGLGAGAIAVGAARMTGVVTVGDFLGSGAEAAAPDMGQFLDHDITFDTTSRLGVPTRPITAPNARIPAFDLDSVHGDGPAGSPILYNPNDKVMQESLHLGPVGGRIVGEVFIGLLQTDPNSYFNVQPSWKPTLPTKTGNPEDFRMIDFLTFAGVDPASRDQ